MILMSHHTIDGTGGWSVDVEPKSVTIGDRTRVGARALPGARIVADVMVAAGAVASGPLESFGVYTGVPARRIRGHRDQGATSQAPDGGRAR